MLGLLSDMLAEVLVVMPFVLPRQQITDWKKGISRLQGFEHLPLREVGACLMCCSSSALLDSLVQVCLKVWQAALAPASIGPTFCCPSDTSSVLRAGRACGFAMQTSRLSRGVLPLWHSTSNTCFVCRQTPAKVGRRAGRLIGTARSLVDLRSLYYPWCSLFLDCRSVANIRPGSLAHVISGLLFWIMRGSGYGQ